MNEYISTTSSPFHHPTNNHSLPSRHHRYISISCELYIIMAVNHPVFFSHPFICKH